jgi:hypothetical protein
VFFSCLGLSQTESVRRTGRMYRYNRFLSFLFFARRCGIWQPIFQAIFESVEFALRNCRDVELRARDCELSANCRRVGCSAAARKTEPRLILGAVQFAGNSEMFQTTESLGFNWLSSTMVMVRMCAPSSCGILCSTHPLEWQSVSLRLMGNFPTVSAARRRG